MKQDQSDPAIATFFSTQGRVGAIRFAAMAGAIAAIFWILAWGFATLGTATYPLLGALGGAAIAKLFAEAGRRRHDTGGSATLGVLVLVATLLGCLSILFLLVDGLAAIATGAICAIVLYATFFRPGQPIISAYGKPAAGFRLGMPEPPLADRRSLAWAALSILGCAVLGLAAQTTGDQVRADRARRADLQTQPPPFALMPGSIAA